MTTKIELLARIEASYKATGRGLSLTHKDNFQQCSDLDGAYARKYLEDLGFVVITNGDNGRRGFVHTECGLDLSTNGHIGYRTVE
jgi:hypothetical protein